MTIVALPPPYVVDITLLSDSPKSGTGSQFVTVPFFDHVSCDGGFDRGCDATGGECLRIFVACEPSCVAGFLAIHADVRA